MKRALLAILILAFPNDRYGRTLDVVNVEGKNVNLEMPKADLAEVYRGRAKSEFDNDPYWKTEQEAREVGREFGSRGIGV